MRLRDLDAQFLTLVPDAEGRQNHHYVATLAEAHGIMFLCPKCFATNKGRVGTHSVICWFVGRVPDDAYPKPGRWIPQGLGVDDLTFAGASGKGASVNLDVDPPGGGCKWHGHVKNGDAS